MNRFRTLAITGGTGFVGRHLLRLAIAQGFAVRALTRREQPAEWGVEWIAGALDDADALGRLVAGSDAVIHVAGAINAPDRAAFERDNALGTMALVEAALDAGVRRLIHVSSLAAREPALSDYGWSKARSETIVAASGLDWTIVRPPAVYGAGDREMLQLFRMAARGLVLLPPRGRFSVIEVSDLARLLLALLPDEDSWAQLYEPDDGMEFGWDHRDFAHALGDAVGRRARPLPVPARLLRLVSRVERIARRGRARLTADRVRYFSHPDWVVTAARQPPAALWRPQVETRAGLGETAQHYRAAGWLK